MPLDPKPTGKERRSTVWPRIRNWSAINPEQVLDFEGIDALGSNTRVWETRRTRPRSLWTWVAYSKHIDLKSKHEEKKVHSVKVGEELEEKFDFSSLLFLFQSFAHEHGLSQVTPLKRIRSLVTMIFNYNAGEKSSIADEHWKLLTNTLEKFCSVFCPKLLFFSLYWVSSIFCFLFAHEIVCRSSVSSSIFVSNYSRTKRWDEILIMWTN